MRSYYQFRNVSVAFALVVISACASWQASVKNLGDATYEAVSSAARTADSMVASGAMTKLQRQEFAKTVTVPALTALDEAITATLAWKEGDPIPENVSKLIGILTKAVDNIASTFGKTTQLYNDMLEAKAAASEFLEKVQ